MHSNITKLLALMLTLVMVLGLFAGCGQKTEAPAVEEKPEESAPVEETPKEEAPVEEAPVEEEAAPANDTLVVGYAPFSQKFTPFFADTAYDQDVVAMTQIALLGNDREGNIIMNGIEGETRAYNGTDYFYNGVADCVITENADGTVAYDFTIREDLKFSDGTPVTADDIIFTLYVLSDPTYTGSSTFYAQPIVGMEEYRSGMDTLFNLLAAAGRENTDFTNWDEATQTAFWADVDQAGAQFAQEIVDYCVAMGYDVDVAGGAELWGYAGLPAEATAADFFAMMYEAYAGDLAALSDTETAGTSLYDFMENYAAYSVGVSVGSGAANIAGIEKTGDYSVRITMSKIDATAIYQLAQQITPLHYYGDVSLYDYANNMFGFVKGDLSGVHAKDTVPLGAGPYVFTGYENGVVSFEANPYYFNGEPKIKYVKFQETAEADKLTGLATGLFDVTDPSFTNDVVDGIKGYNSNGELTGDAIMTTSVDNLGYGYIGINADTVLVGTDPTSAESKALRTAFATLFAAYREPVINAYYGDRAAVINYPISNTSWAAPKPADEGYKLAYSTDVDGNVVITADMAQEDKEAKALEMAIGFFKAAGYTFDDATGMFTAAPEGAAMNYEIIIPADGSGDHPVYGVLTSVKNALETIGITLNINDPADSNELWNAMDAGTQNMWAAAWNATIDPDMYQVYHSSNIVGKGGTDSNHYHIADAELDALIMEARATTDQAFRKATYKQCLEIIMDWGVEIPAYQRQNCVIFSSERVNTDTITPDITTFYGWMAECDKMEMN
ncbi:MAG: ABC transporter substrate-binding protein [Oscillospiraceae bacterium]|nr:ABC transporter substrate-binding protein [Oscillospiraceae bacterium]